jgi:hypothetical protein
MFRIRIHLIRIRIQHFRLNIPDLDPDPIQIQGFDVQKFKKITAENNLNFFYQKLHFTPP